MSRHVWFLLSAGVVASAAALLASAPLTGATLLADGPPDGVAADAPFFYNCTVCHNTNALDSGDGSLALSGVPVRYTPGATYPLTITVADPGQARWGFELTAHTAGTAQGSFTITDPVNTQRSNSGFGDYVKHTNAGTYRGTANGPVSWSVDWTAPAAGAGTVRFYLAAVAGDDNGSFYNDFVYTAAAASQETGASAALSLTLQPDGTMPRQGDPWAVAARTRNHGGTSQTGSLASRVKLPNNNYYPASGSLHNLIPLSLAPGQQADRTISLSIPATAPLASYTYEGYVVQTSPLVVLASDQFDFEVVP